MVSGTVPETALAAAKMMKFKNCTAADSAHTVKPAQTQIWDSIRKGGRRELHVFGSEGLHAGGAVRYGVRLRR
ncbi:uncharacterized protein N7515_008658 [Penicillium bovifimosum]|uniref:Uncharacterized protein n=1 Tax=Penicillium bovifimosum TaxID=126998 RepID=A0A9W9GND6_9EURO|nr:uncharacterized protein N7515_008658 [Penicillium bovifimosum]KAJ5124833.1 hypothetical protein N7515_008658 [Penicillium bovifimosum]